MGNIRSPNVKIIYTVAASQCDWFDKHHRGLN
jgi:hypothetical protein